MASGKRKDSSFPYEGTWTIDTGTARIEYDKLGPQQSWVLYVNDVPSSHIVIAQPRQLEFEYMRWIAAILNKYVDHYLEASKLRISHLGGAACTMARYCADMYPTSRNTVVELDGKLAELVREQFDIPRAPRVKIRVGEAGEVTQTWQESSRDIVIRDVFAGAHTPAHLTGVNFFTQISYALSPAGLYIANCGDHANLRNAKEELAGMAQVFPYTAVIADPSMLKGRRYGNIILIGSRCELGKLAEDQTLARELLGGAVPAQYHAGQWVERFSSGAKAHA